MQYLFPQGKKKVLTFSYDDARTADRRLVALFHDYGIKGTFHINSGRLGKKGYLEPEEVASLYGGQEIACHGATHAFSDQLSRTQMVNELYQDRRVLEQISHRLITGLSYAYGTYDDRVLETCRSLGFEYARTITATGKYFPPADFLQWNPTCHHNVALREPEIVEKFVGTTMNSHRPLLYLWGHSYEFDNQNTWAAMERLLEKLAGHSDIWYATNIEYCRYISAVRNLMYSADEKTVYNPSAIPVWLLVSDALICVKPAEVCNL